MNILLWVLQIGLGLYYLMGGSWMISKIPKAWLKIMPKPTWMALGVLQILFALGMVLPGAIGMSPQITPISAIGVAVETVLVSVVTKVNPKGLVWVVIPALFSLFVAYERMAQSPF